MNFSDNLQIYGRYFTLYCLLVRQVHHCSTTESIASVQPFYHRPRRQKMLSAINQFPQPKYPKRSYRPFYKACQKGDLEAVVIFVSVGFCPKARNALALRHAITNDRLSVINYLANLKIWRPPDWHYFAIKRRMNHRPVNNDLLALPNVNVDALLLLTDNIPTWINCLRCDMFTTVWDELTLTPETSLMCIGGGFTGLSFIRLIARRFLTKYEHVGFWDSEIATRNLYRQLGSGVGFARPFWTL